MAVCSDPLVELANSGASGSLFYVTDDDEFIVKTVQHKEAEFLQKLLPGYYLVSELYLVPNYFLWGHGCVVVIVLDFRSEGQWLDARSLPLCCFLRQEAFCHIVSPHGSQCMKWVLVTYYKGGPGPRNLKGVGAHSEHVYFYAYMQNVRRALSNVFCSLKMERYAILIQLIWMQV